MLPITYQNGNCSVSLDAEGTKVREWEGDAKPEFPDSVDLKITDFCDAGCAYCHEQSTRRGKPALLKDILSIIEGLPRGVEIAIGGGDPTTYPHLRDLLVKLRDRGLIANMTINVAHLDFGYHLLAKLIRREGLLHGIGLSYRAGMRNDIREAMHKHNIVHVIAGVHSVNEVLKFDKDWKILVLGYKRYGFGNRYYDRKPVEKSLQEWRYWIGRLMRSHRVCFDNLALEQLKIKRWLSQEAWDTLYMGDDGEFTMYVDAVRGEFAQSSTSQRIPIGGRSIREMFAEVRSKRKLTVLA